MAARSADAEKFPKVAMNCGSRLQDGSKSTGSLPTDQLLLPGLPLLHRKRIDRLPLVERPFPHERDFDGVDAEDRCQFRHTAPCSASAFADVAGCAPNFTRGGASSSSSHGLSGPSARNFTASPGGDSVQARRRSKSTSSAISAAVAGRRSTVGASGGSTLPSLLVSSNKSLDDRTSDPFKDWLKCGAHDPRHKVLQAELSCEDGVKRLISTLKTETRAFKMNWLEHQPEEDLTANRMVFNPSGVMINQRLTRRREKALNQLYPERNPSEETRRERKTLCRSYGASSSGEPDLKTWMKVLEESSSRAGRAYGVTAEPTRKSGAAVEVERKASLFNLFGDKFNAFKKDVNQFESLQDCPDEEGQPSSPSRALRRTVTKSFSSSNLRSSRSFSRKGTSMSLSTGGSKRGTLHHKGTVASLTADLGDENASPSGRQRTLTFKKGISFVDAELPP